MIAFPKYTTLPQAAQLLRAPYRIAYGLLLTGEIRGEKVGGQWHVDSESLRDYLNRQGLLPAQAEEANG